MEKKLVIRPMEIADLPSVKIIEDESFVDPWSEQDLTYELLVNPLAELLVLTYDEQILGFANYWVTFDSVSIAQIAIYPPARGAGLGLMLLKDVLHRISLLEEVKMITLEVRENNLAARKLYLKAGFHVSHLKPSYYNNGENAIYMIKENIHASNSSD